MGYAHQIAVHPGHTILMDDHGPDGRYRTGFTTSCTCGWVGTTHLPTASVADIDAEQYGGPLTDPWEIAAEQEADAHVWDPEGLGPRPIRD